jgi:tetratricopeptide (TPR) repeat protein
MKIQQSLIVTVLAALSMVTLTPTVSHAQASRTDQHITYYQQQVRRNPQNAKALHGLGDALIRKARETGDPSYFNRAEEALKKSLEIAPQNGGALRHLAYVYYSRHEFAPAALYARKAVENNPEDSDSYGVLGDALLEVGQYAEAQAAYALMIELDESLYSYSRLAGLKSARGDSAGAIDDLRRAIAFGKAAKQPAESVAWTEWQLGAEYFAQGNLPEAEVNYRRSLESFPNYYRALAGLAQVRAAEKKYDEAIALYQKALGVLPMPEYAVALGEIFEKIGKHDQARRQYELVEYIGKLNALNQALYNRELAYFYADRAIKAKEGLELAERELNYRRDIYAYDVLAWNLLRNDRFDEARGAIEKALRLGTKDAKLFYHAGMIYHRLGDLEKSKELLRRALSTNPYFHVLFAEQAAHTIKEIEAADALAALAPPEEGR